jgi:Gram-negative bacterial TonB protein C-terminal
VRCDECKVEPVTPGHFCECCGRKLSLHERKALDEKKPLDEKKAAQTSWGEPAPVLPKASKGNRLVSNDFTPEPYVDEPDPVVDPVNVETHVAGFDAAGPEPTVPVTAPATIDPILEARFAAIEATPASQVSAPPAVEPLVEPDVAAKVPAAHLDSLVSAARCESCGGPAEAGELCSRCQHAFHSVLNSPPVSDPIAVAAPPVPPVVAEPEDAPVMSARPAEPEIAPVVSSITAEPAPAVIAVRAPAAPEVPAVEAAPAAQAPQPVAAAHSLAKSKPAPVAVAAVTSSQRRTSPVRTIGAAIAVLVAVVALGLPLSKLWLGGQETSAFIRQDQPRPPVTQAAALPAEHEAAPAAVATSSTVTRAAAEPSAPDTVQATPKAPAAKVPPVAPKVSPAPTSRTATAKVPPKSAKPTGSMRLAGPVTAPAPVSAAPVPEVAPPAPVAAPEPKTEAPAAPIGQFFETRDVNEAPKIATKVEPQVPDDLRGRPLNEIVIVRVLVTQTGHAHMVNLLRRSKAGSSLDNAIVAAVKQWTFVPARKRGEAVSCWYHVGVPVNQAN